MLQGDVGRYEPRLAFPLETAAWDLAFILVRTATPRIAVRAWRQRPTRAALTFREQVARGVEEVTEHLASAVECQPEPCLCERGQHRGEYPSDQLA